MLCVCFVYQCVLCAYVLFINMYPSLRGWLVNWVLQKQSIEIYAFRIGRGESGCYYASTVCAVTEPLVHVACILMLQHAKCTHTHYIHTLYLFNSPYERKMRT